MRKAFALPTGGMVIGFLVGLGLGFFFGMEFAIVISSLASGFFDSMGLLLGTAFGIILLVMIGFLFVKAWYFMVPFTIGLISGIILNAFLGSSFYDTLTASSIIVTCGARGKRTFDSHGPPSTFKGVDRMKRKILAVVLILCLGLMVMVPEIGATDTIIIKNKAYLDNALVKTQSNSPNTNYYSEGDPGIMNTTTQNYTTLTKPPLPELTQWNGTTIYYSLYCDYSAWSNPTKVMIYLLNSSYNHTEVTYNNRTDSSQWVTPGGDYNRTELTNITVDGTQYSAWGYFKFDLTLFLWDVHNGSLTSKYGLSEFYGFFIINEQNSGGWSRFSEINHSWDITYPASQGSIPTNLYKDIWNLEGYSNTTTKNASTLYSEISNCKALSGKNDTTGYWYTYWPDVGLIENWDIKFGDGLFVLVSADTTWDHT